MTDLFFNINVLNRKSAIICFDVENELHFIVDRDKKDTPLFTISDARNQFSILKVEITFTAIKKGSNIDFIIHPDNQPLEVDGETIELSVNNGRIELSHDLEKGENHVISFKLVDESGTVANGTKLILHKSGEHNQHIKCAVDFGSEASQVIQITDDKLHNRISPVVMGDLMKSLDSNGNLDFDNYVQASDERNNESDKFLRSIFFYQATNAQKDNGSFPSEKYLKFLTATNDINNLLSDKNRIHRILPNLKLGYLNLSQYNIDFEDGEKWHGDNFIVQSKKLILSNFIEAIINFNKRKDSSILLNFTLLYPNVYNQKTLNIIQNELNDILNEKYKAGKISGFEINMISESDAVFLGIKAQYHDWIKPNKNYVIIDSGKGTTDYSIIQNFDGNNFETKFRTGFVGAGNLITFSFLVALVSDIAKSKGLRFNDVAKELFKNLTPSTLFTMSSKLNELKISPRLNNESNDFYKLDLKSTNIINVLENVRSIDDKGGYIDSAVNYIVDKVYQDVAPYLTSSTKIYLSGRSFKFNLLLSKLESKFRGLCEGIVFINEVPKTISLLGAFSNNSESCITIEGVPREIDSKLTDKLIAKDSKTAIWKKITSFVSKNIAAAEGLQLNEMNEFLKMGIKVDISKKPKMVCSNTVYELPSELYSEYEQFPQLNIANIRFDGNKFVALWNQKKFVLEEVLLLFTQEETTINKFSMFPFVDENEFVEYTESFENFLARNYRQDVTLELDDLEIF